MSNMPQSDAENGSLDPKFAAKVEAWLHKPPAVELLEGRDAFFRELPGLLLGRQRDPSAKYAAYHRQQRLGLAPNPTILVNEGLRRGIPREHIFVAGIDSTLLDQESYSIDE